MSLILIGFKATGKTYFGKLLAQELGKTFLDTDHLLEEIFNKEFQKVLSCQEIALAKGDLFFRHFEKKVIQSLNKEENLIISLGGGAVLDQENCLHLKSLGTLIYLETNIDTLKQRIWKRGVIPSFLNPDDFDGSFERVYHERKEIYETWASITVNTDGKTDIEILTELKKVYS